LTAPFRILLVSALSIWIVVLALGIATIAWLARRRGRTAAWPTVFLLAPLVDLVGTWAGVLAVGALLLGRVGYGWPWAAALGLVALMVTASLYDRAVLLPSLDAAWKRLPAAAGPSGRWERDWRFLWRMAGLARAVTLIMGVAALVCGWVA
jgi:hypothetical protein